MLSPRTERVPCPSRVLCERAGLLADVAAAGHRIHGRLSRFCASFAQGWEASPRLRETSRLSLEFVPPNLDLSHPGFKSRASPSRTEREKDGAPAFVCKALIQERHPSRLPWVHLMKTEVLL